MPTFLVEAQSAIWTTRCFLCQIEFGMTREYYQKRQEDRLDFWCPNGHAQHFIGKTPTAKRIEELEADVACQKAEVDRQRRQREWAETQARGAAIARGKAQAAKRRLEHRIACGVCPQCHRTFKQLAAHMKAKHSHD